MFDLSLHRLLSDVCLNGSARLLGPGATVPPAGGEGEPARHRVAVERHHGAHVPVSDGAQRPELHPGGGARSAAEHHGRTRHGAAGSSLSVLALALA